MSGSAKSTSKLNMIEGYIVNIEEGIVFVTLAIVLLGIGLGVLHRYLIQGALVGLEEICVLAGVWMYFMGACLTTHGETHIKGDIIGLFIKNWKTKRNLDVAIKIATIFVLIFATFKAYQYINQILTINVLTTGLKISKAYFLASMFVGFILMIFHEFVGIVRLASRKA